MREKSSSRVLSRHYHGQLFAALTLGAALVGCAADADAPATAPAAEVLEARGNAGGSLRDPRGAFFADVTANGTGCPAGTWETNLSSDGQTFTTTFSAYETSVDRRTSVSVKDCQLTVKLRSPAGRSYSIQSFHYQGYAFLERGVSGRQMADYYFQGDPTTGDSARTDLSGPYDRPYLFSDDVAVANVWSPCGLERNLNIATRIRLTNNDSGRSGYMNMSSVDGSSRLVFRIASRACNNDSGNNGGWDDDNGDNGGWDDDNGGWDDDSVDNGGWDDDDGDWDSQPPRGGIRSGSGSTGGPVIVGVERS
jgi:hypothetical protein